MADIEKLDGESLDIVEQNIEQLKELFPSVFSEGKIQFNKLEELLGHYVVEDEDHYNFTWHGKRKAGRLAQTPSTGTLRPCKEESVDWDTTENIFIEGDNLEVLKLLQKSYHRQVKMIYIDPPYNTGNDFVYEDDFKDGVKNYLEMTDQLDGEGKKFGTNSSTAGRYHTNWLNMIYPRLKLAKNLLKDDGIIFISIDNGEYSNLKKICDEIFGEENFIESVTWHKKNSAKGVPPKNMVVNIHEYILCYSKSHLGKLFGEPRTEDTFSNPDNDPRGLWRRSNIKSTLERSKDKFTITDPETGREFTNYWAYSEDTLATMIEEKRILFPKNADGLPKQKEFLDNFANPNMPVMSHFGLFHSQDKTEKAVEKMMEIKSFLYRKPVELMKKIVMQAGNEDRTIVLDFFAGSATTAHAVMQLNSEDNGNRCHITVQLPEPISEDTEAYKSGLKNISDVSKERIRRAAKKIKDENPDYEGDLGFKVFKLDSSNIKRWDADFDTLEQDLVDAVDYLVEGRSDEDVLYELCLKLGLDLSVKIEEETVAGEKLFVLGRGYLVVCLSDNVTMDVVKGIGDLKDKLASEDGMRVVFKDDGFKDDVIKTNALQTLKRFGITDIKSL